MLTKQINPFRIKASQVARDMGFENTMEMLEEYGHESVMPACCKEGCEVEPDGTCEHDCPSVLLAMGLI